MKSGTYTRERWRSIIDWSVYCCQYCFSSKHKSVMWVININNGMPKCWGKRSNSQSSNNVQLRTTNLIGVLHTIFQSCKVRVHSQRGGRYIWKLLKNSCLAMNELVLNPAKTLAKIGLIERFWELRIQDRSRKHRRISLYSGLIRLVNQAVFGRTYITHMFEPKFVRSYFSSQMWQNMWRGWKKWPDLRNVMRYSRTGALNL